MKILTILWLVSPASNGCLKAYKNVVIPLFQTREHVSLYVAVCAYCELLILLQAEKYG